MRFEMAINGRSFTPRLHTKAKSEQVVRIVRELGLSQTHNVGTIIHGRLGPSIDRSHLLCFLTNIICRLCIYTILMHPSEKSGNPEG
jgi:hypothetical protein